MKASSIIKIVCWAVVALLLIGVLVSAIRGNGTFFNFGCRGVNFSNYVSFTGMNSYPDADAYTVGNGSVPAAGISEIEVHWISGSVDIAVCDGDKITITEADNIDNDYKLRYYANGSRLIIQFCKSGMTHMFNTPNKNLRLEVPSSIAVILSKLNVDTVSSSTTVNSISAAKMIFDSTSGDFNLSNISTTELSIDTTSGEAVLNNVTADTFDYNSTSGSLTATNLSAAGIDFDSTSGSANITGKVNGLSGNTVSGSISLNSTICPATVNCDTTSGDVTLRIPENNGFTAEQDSVSGDLSCNFPVISSGDKKVYKDGSAQFDFDSVSGDVFIYQN